HMNKPIQAIKKLEDHFHKLSKKNKSVTTDTILPVNRTIDNTSKTTDASRTTDTSRSVIFVESTRNNESSQESIINRNVEQVESH
ncbi:hypothetical protein WUBG_10281, partial [Wuchereria bancrofti]